jgi:protein-arginine kinase activator protein McsA
LWKQTNGEDESDDAENEANQNADSPIDIFWSMSLGHVPSEGSSADEFPGDEDLVDEMDEESDEAESDQDASGIPFEATSPNLLEQSSTQIFGAAAQNVTGAGEVASVRCPKCGTTWDRLKQDGRAGCAQCYSAFSAQLSRVMTRVQRSSQHAGKAPRTAEKRQRRLMHLRARRDHRLEMLNRRLEQSVAQENYEEAAKLRDKIKILTSTIVDE